MPPRLQANHYIMCVANIAAFGAKAIAGKAHRHHLKLHSLFQQKMEQIRLNIML